MSREIEVWADWRELGAPMRMGHLRSTPSLGKEVFSFSYDQAWLDAGHSRQLDPDLRFYSGPQYLNATDRPNFGIFLDSSPDRWGRLLMQRREAAQARVEGRSTHRLQETDYLLSVHDEQRTGALRFKETPTPREWTDSKTGKIYWRVRWNDVNGKESVKVFGTPEEAEEHVGVIMTERKRHGRTPSTRTFAPNCP